jgi:hypothetical protein
MRASQREHPRAHPASDELTSKFKFESQCGPIPLNGDGRAVLLRCHL